MIKFMLQVLLLNSIFEQLEGADNFEIKVDYYEQLIRNDNEATKNYKMRSDNTDFFTNKTCSTTFAYGTFDFIIIGAGSSGSVVANRLSENRKWKILLLEAGGEDDDLSDMPARYSFLQKSDKNWGYTTTAQKNGCYGMKNRQCLYPRGKVIGGTGTINGLMYVRGHKNDYDQWEKLGNAGWSYQNISYYFKKCENSQIPDAEQEYHGFAGLLNTAYSTPESPLMEAFIKAHQELGEPYIDINANHDEGVGRCPNNILFGKRVSAGNSYLKSARNRLNLNVTTKSFVTKVIIDENTKNAKGVKFIKNGLEYEAFAVKEVILSAGAVNTPQLLMLSGIGPTNELEKHGIKMIENLPVGRGAKDHLIFDSITFRTNITGNIIPLRQQIRDYLNGHGILTTVLSSKGLSFKIFNNSKVEFFIVDSVGQEIFASPPRNLRKEIEEQLPPYNATTDFTIGAILLKPKSDGIITLKSANPRDFPDFDSRIFSSMHDMEILYQAIKYAYALGKTRAFKQFNATPYFRFKPCEMYEENSKDFWFCAMKYLSYNFYHLSSTAKMGPPSDPTAVVDSDLKVYGINNLRVIDCSIMPDSIAGHPNAIAFAIGEKGSDLIKNSYRCQNQSVL